MVMGKLRCIVVGCGGESGREVLGFVRCIVVDKMSLDMSGCEWDGMLWTRCVVGAFSYSTIVRSYLLS